MAPKVIIKLEIDPSTEVEINVSGKQVEVEKTEKEKECMTSKSNKVGKSGGYAGSSNDGPLPEKIQEKTKEDENDEEMEEGWDRVEPSPDGPHPPSHSPPVETSSAEPHPPSHSPPGNATSSEDDIAASDPTPRDHYVVTRLSGARFHRPGCRNVSNRSEDHVYKGIIACETCLPNGVVNRDLKVAFWSRTPGVFHRVMPDHSTHCMVNFDRVLTPCRQCIFDT